MTYDNANDVVHGLFKSILSKWQIGLEKLIRATFVLSIQFNCCVTNVAKYILKVADHIKTLPTE